MANIAVINISGSQYLVKPGDTIKVNKMDQEAGSELNPSVLLSTDSDKILFNSGDVKAKLIETKKDKKVSVVKFKAKSRYRRNIGHRQTISMVEIVSVNGEAIQKTSPKSDISDEIKSKSSQKPKAEVKAPKSKSTK